MGQTVMVSIEYLQFFFMIIASAYNKLQRENLYYLTCNLVIHFYTIPNLC